MMENLEKVQAQEALATLAAIPEDQVRKISLSLWGRP